MTEPAVQVNDNDAGKSTTIKILCTRADPVSGSARVAGHDPGMLPMPAGPIHSYFPAASIVRDREFGFPR